MTTDDGFVPKRLFWRVPGLDTPEGPRNAEREIVPEEDANLVGSLTNRGTHMPCIDIDLPCRLVPSITEGNYHLYIEKEMTWEQYERLLGALAAAGIIEWKYYAASVNRGATFLRKDPSKVAPEAKSKPVDYT